MIELNLMIELFVFIFPLSLFFSLLFIVLVPTLSSLSISFIRLVVLSSGMHAGLLASFVRLQDNFFFWFCRCSACHLSFSFYCFCKVLSFLLYGVAQAQRTQGGQPSSFRFFFPLCGGEEVWAEPEKSGI